MNFQQKLHHTPILRQTMQDFVQSKKSVVHICAAKRSNESPSGAFKRPNGLAQQDGGASPRQVPVCVKFGCVVDGCRPAKGCVRKWLYGFANGQQELSTTEEVNGKNMEKSTMEKLKIRFHHETNDLDYVPVGDYYLPDLTLDEQLSAHC